MPFQKGHKLNIDNSFAKGNKHTEEWKHRASKRMKGNTNGFKIGKPSPRKGKKYSGYIWNRGKKLPQYSGENHPNWIADRSKIKRQNRHDNPLYKEWRRAVWIRDGYTCKMRNSDCSGHIEAHHILNWIEYQNLRFDINNGITLCHFHHPRKRITEKQLTPLFKTLIDSIAPYLN